METSEGSPETVISARIDVIALVRLILSINFSF